MQHTKEVSILKDTTLKISARRYKNCLVLCLEAGRCDFLDENGPRRWGPFLESSGNLPGLISIFLKVFFADYTGIKDMVIGQCFHRIIRF